MVLNPRSSAKDLAFLELFARNYGRLSCPPIPSKYSSTSTNDPFDAMLKGRESCKLICRPSLWWTIDNPNFLPCHGNQALASVTQPHIRFYFQPAHILGNPSDNTSILYSSSHGIPTVASTSYSPRIGFLSSSFFYTPIIPLSPPGTGWGINSHIQSLRLQSTFSGGSTCGKMAAAQWYSTRLFFYMHPDQLIAHQYRSWWADKWPKFHLRSQLGQ